ncbi:MAG: hypothetical protein STHCBS139747_007654 [Sporothrix thermara]
MDSDQAARRDAILEAWLSQRLDSVKETNAINDTDEMTQSDERSYSLYKDSIGLSQNKTDRFYRCWGHSNCGSCLGTSACSWCPFSATCVPNDHLVPALAPAWEGDLMCPYWAERWEVRTRPLGCQVSTITSLTALVAGALTLAVVLQTWAIVLVVRKLRQRRWQWPQRWGAWPTIRTALWRAPEEPAALPSPATQPPSEQSPLLSSVR